MSRAVHVRVGFATGTGEPVDVPVAHMCVLGVTQRAGKTTALEALAGRAGGTTLAFITKRGEGAFRSAHRVAPYYRPRCDWLYLDTLLEAQLREKNKFLRPWIIRLCRDVKSLGDVHRKIKKGLPKAKGLTEGVYTQLDAYLDLIVPEVEKVPLTPRPDLRHGLNVMDVSGYQTPMQMLFIQASLDWVNEHAAGVKVVIPEAWETIPEGKGSPVKASAVTLVRKGAALENFVWADAQDAAALDKTILRACSVWLFGVQREANEIRRNLANIPAGVRKPKADDIAHLKLGEFFVCWADQAVRTYVQPSWLSEDQARAVARGVVPPPSRAVAEVSPPAHQEVPVSQPPPGDDRLDRLVSAVEQLVGRGRIEPPLPALPPFPPPAGVADEDALYERFKARLLKEAPALLKVALTKPELEVAVERPTVTADGDSAVGLIALLIADGFFNSVRTAAETLAEMQRRGFQGIAPRVYEAFKKLTPMGFLTKEPDGWKAVPDMKSNTVKKEKQ